MSTQRIQAPTGGVSIVWRQAGVSDQAGTLLPKRGHKLTVGTGGYGKESWAYVATGSTQDVQPGLLSNTSTFFAPTVSAGEASVLPGLLTNSQTFYAPTVTGGTTTVAPDLFTNDSTFYGPSITTGGVSVAPSLLTNMQAFYGPTIQVGVNAPLLTNSQSFYGPTVEQGAPTLYPPLLVNEQTFFSPTIIGGIQIQPSTGGIAGRRRAYLINGRKRWLNEVELALVVANELLPKSEVKTVKNGKIKPVPAEVWKEVTSLVESIKTTDQIQEDDEDEEMMLLYA